MTPEHDPLTSPSETSEASDAGGPMITAPVVGVVALLIGLLGGYVLFGRPAPAPVAANTATATYAPDTTGPATLVALGRTKARNLKTLDEWDPLDPFDGGFPLPPPDWTPPLLALNPPIPVPARVATTEGTPGPLGGANYPSMPPPAIRGDLPNLPPMAPPSFGGGTEIVPANPGTPGDPTVPGTGTAPAEVPMTRGAIYAGITLSGVNEKAAQSTLSALAAKYGGVSRAFTHMGTEGDVEAEGVLLLVAPSDVDKALSDIRKLGQVTSEDKSEGTVKSRQSRLSAIFNSRLTTLRKRRAELLIQFLEDADPIKTIDAAIDREARALGAVRVSGAADRLAAIRVLLKA